MNCRQARALFSSRLDGELRVGDAGRLQQHLAVCSLCASRWTSFEATVRMLHTLPPTTADPSFVGQVLDRVRGFEAGQAALPETRRWALPSLSGILERITWPSILTPAGLGGAVALGLLVGFLAVQGDWLGVRNGSSPGYAGAGAPGAATTAVPSAALTGRGAAMSGAMQPDHPFADLAPMAGQGRPAGAATDTSVSGSATPATPQFLPGDPQGLGRPVRLDEPDGRPQIIF